VIYFSAQGKRLTQQRAEAYAASDPLVTTSTPEIITEPTEQENYSNKTETPLVNQKSKKRLILICGHYEGIDHRVIDQLVDTEICIGPFVLTGGELPAQIFIDAVARLLPNVLGKEASHQEESFSDLLDGGLEYPHYTRPSDFRGHPVPEILLSGHHAKIEAWRLEQSKLRTKQDKEKT
jgi:tRNA (guanine37-N1)-methyltransferase